MNDRYCHPLEATLSEDPILRALFHGQFSFIPYGYYPSRKTCVLASNVHAWFLLYLIATLFNGRQGRIFRLTLRISTLFIMILQGRQGPKSAEQQRAKTQSETKYPALLIGQMPLVLCREKLLWTFEAFKQKGGSCYTSSLKLLGSGANFAHKPRREWGESTLS